MNSRFHVAESYELWEKLTKETWTNSCPVGASLPEEHAVLSHLQWKSTYVDLMVGVDLLVLPRCCYHYIRKRPTAQVC